MTTTPVFVVRPGALVAGPVAVDGPEGRHAATVRRMAVGEPIELVDGAGSRGRGTVAEVGRDRIVVSVTGVVAEPLQRPRVVVVQALPKGDRGERAVEAMTEVGVDAIVPWTAARSITQWRGDRGQRALERWRSTAREAGKQARRARFPVVADLATTGGVVHVLRGAALGLALYESADRPLASYELPATGDVVLVVGPEGGLTDDELAAFAGARAHAVRLGPTVLRTSTAGVVAASLVLARTRWS